MTKEEALKRAEDLWAQLIDDDHSTKYIIETIAENFLELDKEYQYRLWEEQMGEDL